MTLRPKKIWVLMGGPSTEREVSLKTGKGITEALRSKGFVVEAYDVHPGPSLQSLNWKQPPELVVLGLHGTFGEDGTIQGFLSSLQIPYTGSGVFASSLCFHKGLTKKQLQAHNLPCPFSWDVESEVQLRQLFDSGKTGNDFFTKNWFLKAARQGSTIGIERYRGSESPSEAKFLEIFRKVSAFDPYVLIEEWVEGAEITVPILAGKAMPIVEIRPLSHFYDYESKYTVGRSEYLCPAPFDPAKTVEIQKIAEKAFEILECQDYARVDLMMGAEGPKILELNTLPGMTGTSLVPKSAAAAGLNYADFLEKLVLHSFARQQRA